MERRDNEDRLLRTFVMLQPLIDSFKHGLPVITVDACHLRNQYKGCLKAVTMLDGLKQTQLLAWVTCPVENGDHWDWFLKHFKHYMPAKDIGDSPTEEGVDPRIITIVSDQEKGIAIQQILPYKLSLLVLLSFREECEDFYNFVEG
jgi:hypothetical protein